MSTGENIAEVISEDGNMFTLESEDLVLVGDYSKVNEIHPIYISYLPCSCFYDILQM